MLTDLILGTAGHIDHGKTSLIKILSGTDTDRLPEEKKRGITIELGYAHLELPPFRLGIVDVPGHEKFVRQMLAGATGMDLALLVVAGDDSIKQQTTEHLDILRLLDLPTGVIALTKCDLSDSDWLDLVEEEIRQLVSDTFLKDAPIVRTSSKTGAGIDDLKAALLKAAETVAATDRQFRIQAPFRMAIDRAFSIEGHGTVVTGSVSSGRLQVGDQVEIQPGQTPARVRGLQHHDSSTESVQRGQRAAINLAGVSLQQIERGHELCSVGHLVPSQLMTVRLHLLSRVNKPLKDRTRIRFHVGTAELFGIVRLLEGDELRPGGSAIAQIFLSEPAVAVWNQPFVMRRQSPVETIGGGRILHPNSHRIRKPTSVDLEMINLLASLEPMERASGAAYLSDDKNWRPAELARTAGVVNFDEAYKQLIATNELFEISISPTRTVTIHRQRFEQLAKRVLKTLARLHEQHPLRFSHARSSIDSEFAYLQQKELLNLVIAELNRRKEIVANVNSIGLRGYGPKLSKGQKSLMEELVAKLKASELAVPNVGELQSASKKNKESVMELVQLASENGELVRVSDELYFHADVMAQTKAQLTEAIRNSEGLTMSEIRQVIGTSRKYAVPLCEYFDRIGFTQRNGDKRTLGSTEILNENAV